MLIQFILQICGALLCARYQKKYLHLKKERERGQKEVKEREAMGTEKTEGRNGEREGRGRRRVGRMEERMVRSNVSTAVPSLKSMHLVCVCVRM